MASLFDMRALKSEGSKKYSKYKQRLETRYIIASCLTRSAFCLRNDCVLAVNKAMISYIWFT